MLFHCRTWISILSGIMLLIMAVSITWIRFLQKENATLRQNREQEQWHSEDSLSLLKTILESTADGILALSLEAGITHFNRQFQQLWQVPESILVQQNDWLLISFMQTQLKEPEVFLAQIQAEYECPDLEFQGFLNLKDERVFERYSKPQVCEGKIVGRVVSYRDLSERKQAEEALQVLNQQLEKRVQQRTADLVKINNQLRTEITEREQIEKNLRESEERFCQIAENISEVFWIVDCSTENPEQYETDYISPAYEKIWGRKCEDLYNNPQVWIEAIHPEDQALAKSAITQILQGEPEREYRIIRPDGSLRWIYDRGFPVRNELGKVYRFAGIAEDITKRKQAEQELRQLNQQLEERVVHRTAELETLLNSLPDYLFVVERQEMRFSFCNQLFAQGIGFADRATIQGKTIFECFTPELANYFRQQNQQVFESGETLHWEETMILPNGEHHFDTYKIPLKDSTGYVYALLGAARDLTELIATKQALSDRTTQLEATNKELDSFCYSVSHDLRAPLRHIYGFVKALRQQLEKGNAFDDPKITHYLQVIEESSQKMGRLIDGLLTLSRVGRCELILSSVDLRSLVEEVIGLLSPQINGDKMIQFRIGYLPTVRGDATLLQQVFVNLLDNAIKFSRGRSEAMIEIDSLPDQTIFVRDNGVGFSMQYADQLFGAFQRLHSQKEYEGMGIGLSIVQRIIHRHGGKIWPQSELNQGTTFYFTLKSP